MTVKKRNEIRLNNVLFPYWMLVLFPATWLVILPGNFIIDSLVLLASMAILGTESKKQCYKKHILPIFAFGMISDIIGGIYMFLMLAVFEVANMGDELFLTIPAIIISAVVIFVFNYFFTFRSSEKAFRLKMSLIFAIVTAPYTFLIPNSWMY